MEQRRGGNTKETSPLWPGHLDRSGTELNKEPTPSWAHPPASRCLPHTLARFPGAWLTGLLSHRPLLDLGAASDQGGNFVRL